MVSNAGGLNDTAFAVQWDYQTIIEVFSLELQHVKVLQGRAIFSNGGTRRIERAGG
ncbi:hypothetical protein D3C76_1354300 [compost metagenome]